MGSIKDPDGAEIRELGRLIDFTDRRVLEVGSGVGRPVSDEGRRNIDLWTG